MQKIKSLFTKIDLWVLIIFVFLFSLFLRDKSFLFGDFAAYFNHANYSMIKELSFSWLSSLYLGFESGFYSFIRMPSYFLIDLFNLLFGVFSTGVFIGFFFFLRYFIFKKLLLSYEVKKNFATLVSLVFTLNPYFIDRLGHTYIWIATIFIPLLILSLKKILDKNSLDIKSVITAVFSVIILFSSMHMTLMCVYMFIFLLPFLFVEGKSSNKYKIKNIIILGSLSILGSFYVIAPYFYRIVTNTEKNVIQMVADGASNAILIYSRTTIMPLPLAGLGFFYSDYLKNDYIITLCLLLTTIMMFFILKTKNKNLVWWGYFVILLEFLFLSSFSLFEKFVPFLKSHLIGYASLKDSGYFIFFVVFALHVLFALSLREIKKINFVNYFLILSVVYLVFINIYAFKTFDVFTTGKSPDSYSEVRESLGSEERSLILPLGWITQFDWSNNKLMSGFFNLYFADKEIIGQVILEGPTEGAKKVLNRTIGCFMLNCPDIQKELVNLNTQKIINFKNSTEYPTNKPSNYSSQLKTLLDSKYIYLLKSHLDYDIYAVNLKFIKTKVENISYYKRENPTKIVFTLNSMGIKSHEVIFNESYHSEWRLFPAKTFSWWKAPFIKPLADTKEAHVLYNEYANKWTLNEGEMDLAKDEKGESGFVLYFLPQSYFYYGLIVSLSTFLYLSFSLLRNRFKHSTKK